MTAVAGPDAVHLRTPVETRGEGLSTVAEFAVSAGDRVPFVLTWHRSFDPPPKPIDPEKALAETLGWWEDWAGRCTYVGHRKDLVLRSLITLKALTYAPSGGIVAGVFLPCTFWLADNYALLGEREKARALFDRLAGLCNDVGLVSEEYDPHAGRLVGNFPQAFTHVGLINTAMNLSRGNGPAEQRKRC